MANLTLVFAMFLVLLGLIGFFATGSAHPTALIPALVGVLLGICGLLARKPERRKLFMHIAVTLGLLGFLATTQSIYKMFQIAQHQFVLRHSAVYAQFIMCVVCLVFVVLCVRSFVAVRRLRAD